LKQGFFVAREAKKVKHRTDLAPELLSFEDRLLLSEEQAIINGDKLMFKKKLTEELVDH